MNDARVGVALVVDRVVPKKVTRSRLAESIEEAYRRGQGRCRGRSRDGSTRIDLTRMPACSEGHHVLEEELTPRLFSYNHHSGACPRCHGLMVSVMLEDAEGTIAKEPVIACRCLLCGEILDPTIAENRRRPRKPLPRTPVPRLGVPIGQSAHRGYKHKQG